MRQRGKPKKSQKQENSVPRYARVATAAQQRCAVNRSAAAAIQRPQAATQIAAASDGISLSNKNKQHQHHPHQEQQQLPFLHFSIVGPTILLVAAAAAAAAAALGIRAPTRSTPSTPGAPTYRPWRRAAAAAAVAAAVAPAAAAAATAAWWNYTNELSSCYQENGYE